jgi:replicative DNA helicase
VAAAYAEDETAPELMIQKAVEISGQAHGSRVRKSGDIINSVWTRFEDYKEGKRRMGIPFGIKELDAMTYGCCPGELILIGGRPSYGKSVLLAHVLLGAAKSGKTPLLFSNEMTSEDFGERLCNMEARVDANKSRGGKLDAEEWDRLATAHAELSNMNFLIDDMPCPLTKLCARARSAAISDNIGIILIDYIQLIECDTKTTNRDGQIETVARTLKQLALELNIPVVTPSQFSRAVEKRDDKRPLLSDLRDGGNQEGHADKVLLLDNPLPKDHQIGEALEQRRCRVYVAKHRGGRIGEVPLWFTPYYTRFDGEVTE